MSSSTTSTLGGIRTRGLRIGSRPPGVITSFDHESVEGSGGRNRTCDLAGKSRVSFQLDHTGLGQAEAAGLEPADGGGRLRVSNALPFQLGHASKKAEGDGVEPPRP